MPESTKPLAKRRGSPPSPAGKATWEADSSAKHFRGTETGDGNRDAISIDGSLQFC